MNAGEKTGCFLVSYNYPDQIGEDMFGNPWVVWAGFGTSAWLCFEHMKPPFITNALLSHSEATTVAKGECQRCNGTGYKEGKCVHGQKEVHSECSHRLL